MMSNQNVKWIIAALLCTNIVTGLYLIFQNNQLNSLREEYQKARDELEIFSATIDLMIDYGNGTVTWYNDTRIIPGESLLSVTNKIAQVEYTESEFGAFINSINGVEGGMESFWIWNYYEGSWKMGLTGAEKKYLHEGDIVSWEYTDSF